MRENGKTLAFVVVATLLMGTALVASIPRANSVEDFIDLGQPFFPEFTDPAQAASLEIDEFNPTTIRPLPLKVMFKDGKWIIPSHSNYPADAKDRLAQTAAQVIGLTKDTIRSSRAEDHKSLGVLDPLDPKLLSAEGVGKRITLRDKSDRVLADYIIGKDVPGAPGRKFVRRPNAARTYGVNIEVEPSARFSDWIEPNLLQVKAADIRRATFNNTKVDIDQGVVIQGESLKITRPDDHSPWTLAGLPPDQEVDPAKAGAMVNALADLKIVGVRPKPEALPSNAPLQTEEAVRRERAARFSLQDKGFYFVKGKYYSDEGDLQVGCNDGVSYTLRFGKLTFDQGEALSAGTGEDAKKEATKSSEGGVESRFLFVTADFDPDLIPKPPVVPPPTEDDLPRDVFQKTASEIRAEAEKKQGEAAEYERRVKDGQKRASDLSKRFAPWYYVVPGDAYRSLVLDRKALVKPKSAAPPERPSLPFGGEGMFPPGGLRPGGSGRLPSGHP